MQVESKIIQGLMRLSDLSVDDLYKLIRFDLDNGVKYFDISDIYLDGEAEKKLGEVLLKHPELRKEMFIQTKCGICKDRKDDIVFYDLSYEHILESVDKSLERMNLDYIDSLLLHRPDIFIEAHEVARAFATLSQQGKVRHFGVSNFPHEIMKYLYDHTNIPMEINQLQLGLGHLSLVNEVFDIDDEDAWGMAKAVAQTEGLPIGISAGAAMTAAIDIASREAFKNKNIVVILPDAVINYISEL